MLILLILSGCTGTSGKWLGLESGTTESQTASKTHNYSLKWVDEATLNALDQMEIMIVENKTSPEGKSIQAATLDQDIFITLKPVDSSSTYMQIDIELTDNGDPAASANDIIEQTQRILLTNTKLQETDITESSGVSHDTSPKE